MLKINLVKDLISIPSQIDIDNEKEISKYLCKILKEKGFNIEMYEFLKDRPNIIANYKFEKNGPTIIFNGHMDTVKYYNGQSKEEWNTNPSEATIIDDKVYGRGACDMKGGIASALSAIFHCIDNNSGCGNIVVNLVSDEENTGLYGTLPICENNLLTGDIAIVMEPTENTVCNKQLGNMFFKTSIKGIGGHTGISEGKINPFDISYSYIEKLREWIITKRKNQFDNQPFINIGNYNGGTSSGTIPSECELYWGTRVMPEDNFVDYMKEVLEITSDFQTTLPKNCEIKTVLFEGGGIDSFECHSEIINNIIKISEKEKGIFTASSDAGFINNILNIPTIVFGPGSLKQAHVSNEYISIEEMEKYSNMIYEFLTSLGE